MAYSILAKPNVIAADATYPFGDIRDRSGITPGTPGNRLVYADFHQFFAKLMNEAGVTPNDLPDNATNGFQLIEALIIAGNYNTTGNLYSITQTGTTDPTLSLESKVSVLPFNSISATRIGVGEYEITDSGGFFAPFFVEGTDGDFGAPANSTIDIRGEDGKIKISTKVSGTPTDGVLSSYKFYIKVPTY